MIIKLIKSRILISLFVFIIGWTICFVITRFWQINENIYKDLFTSSGGGFWPALVFYFVLPKINPIFAEQKLFKRRKRIK